VIATLTGEVSFSSDGQVVLEVSGVGYLINTTTAVSKSLGSGHNVRFFTSLVVREDSLTLFGFLESSQLEVFELLRSVNGVGPKSALAILGELGVDQIAQAVAAESDQVFKTVSGIGAKTSKLIVLTLAGKLGSGSAGVSSGAMEASIAGLIGLGWSERESREVVGQISSAEKSEKDLLKEALQILSKARRS
jgi:holliday junction DNA helicase RuvA